MSETAVEYNPYNTWQRFVSMAYSDLAGKDISEASHAERVICQPLAQDLLCEEYEKERSRADKAEARVRELINGLYPIADGPKKPSSRNEFSLGAAKLARELLGEDWEPSMSSAEL